VHLIFIIYDREIHELEDLRKRQAGTDIWDAFAFIYHSLLS
jgi:hypothetical protein